MASLSYFVTPTLSNPKFITPGPTATSGSAKGRQGRLHRSQLARHAIAAITEIQFSFFGVSVGITTGSDGNIWFTDQTDHAVWRYNPSTGVFVEFFGNTHTEFFPGRHHHGRGW